MGFSCGSIYESFQLGFIAYTFFLCRLLCFSNMRIDVCHIEYNGNDDSRN